MAKLEFILQAVTDATHAAAIRALLRSDAVDSVLISVAFVREEGVEAIEEAMRPVADKMRIFAGIRNDVTTVQGIKRLLALNVKVYAVDTAARGAIFHPKLYLAVGKQRAALIIGSANLTFPGLHNNIEASAIATLDLKDRSDRKFIDETAKLFGELGGRHPEHVFQVKNEAHADSLFESGRLSDEMIVAAPAVMNRLQGGKRDTLSPMKLRSVPKPRLRAPLRRLAAAGQQQPAVPVPARALVQAKAAALIQQPPEHEFYLVWESKPLAERDLNVPKGPTTNITGSMSLDKGLLVDIDHRHFFYDDVFQNLRWAPKKKQPHILIAQANMEVIIKDINYGKYVLTLSHNTNTLSASYKQHNAMTNLRWKPIKDLIKNRDLMGRTLSLYRKDTNPPEFMIEID
jgi:hypothetical protein